MSKRIVTAYGRRDIRRQSRKARNPQPVAVRFVCPLCGGPHPRSEHP